MKKYFSLVLCLLLICLFASSAMAAVKFSCDSDTTTFSRWSANTTADGSDWYLSDWTTSNLSDTKQAGFKVYNAPGVYASHTYYYKTTSTASHTYLDTISNGDNVYAAGMRYKGTGNITVAGMFNP